MTKSKPKKRISKALREAYALVGQKGGRATARKGKEYMAELGRRGAAKRWPKSEG